MKNIINSKFYLGVLILLPILLISMGLIWLKSTVLLTKNTTSVSVHSLPVLEIPKSPPSPSNTLLKLPTQTTTKAKNSASLPGILRVSNQTEYPIRLALLTRPTAGQSYQNPAHWDFAPEEGSSSGLVLSLPEGKVRLNKQDILVAFAEDGSRRYWGPYVVGETTMPFWNQQTAEWLLILEH